MRFQEYQFNIPIYLSRSRRLRPFSFRKCGLTGDVERFLNALPPSGTSPPRVEQQFGIIQTTRLAKRLIAAQCNLGFTL